MQLLHICLHFGEGGQPLGDQGQAGIGGIARGHAAGAFFKHGDGQREVGVGVDGRQAA